MVGTPSGALRPNLCRHKSIPGEEIFESIKKNINILWLKPLAPCSINPSLKAWVRLKNRANGFSQGIYSSKIRNQPLRDADFKII